MPKKAKRVDRNDKWYVLAKEQGYRSRAAFKLAQINKEFGLLNGDCRVVLDLCAAPGGWAQVAAKAVSSECGVIAVDLLPIRPIGGVRTLVGDITLKETHDAVKREVRSLVGKNKSGVDVALCDGAPNVGAEYSKDAFVQNEISLAALKCAVDCGLAPGACFVTKVYRGRDYSALLWAFGRLFERVRAFKPAASRSQSAEIFVVCQKYLAPAKVDPKLLDPRTVFGDNHEKPAAALNVLHPKYAEKRRQRDGYDDDLLKDRGATSAEFLKCKDPAQFLAEHSSISFDDDDEDVPAEVRACGQDLRVLNRGDMRLLLKWRMKKLKPVAVAAQAEEESAKGNEESDEESEEEEEVDSEDEAQREIARERGEAAAESRRALKRSRRIEAKKRNRVAMGMTSESAVEIGDEQVFSFTKGLDLGDRGLDSEDEDEQKVDDTFEEYADEGDRDLAIEEQLDESYAAYLERRGKKSSQMPERRLITKRKRDAQAAEIVSDQLAMLDGDVDAYVKDLAGGVDDEDDDDDEGADEEAADRWFAKPIFEDLPEMPKTDKAIRKEKRKKAAERAERKRARNATPEDALEIVAAPLEGTADNGDAKMTEAQREKKAAADKLIKQGMGALLDGKDDAATTTIEVVKPAAPLASFDDDENLDDTSKAENLALATMMLRRSKAKALVDASYNRYAWHDPTDLPEWFVSDEKMHYRPQLPIKPELMAEMKQRFQSLATKPIKKVVEARARNKARANAKLKAAKRKAEALAENPDMTPAQKLRAVQKAMAKGGKIEKPSKVYVVQRKTKGGAISKNTGGKTKNSRVKLVDRRMKKDKRAEKVAEKRKKKHGKRRKS